MAATCQTSSSIPRTSPVPCALVPACGLELARSSTAFPKKTLPLTAASAVRKSTSGELVSSPADWSSRRAITPSPSPAVFSEKNAKNCSVTELHSAPGCCAIHLVHLVHFKLTHYLRLPDFVFCCRG